VPHPIDHLTTRVDALLDELETAQSASSAAIADVAALAAERSA